MGWEESSDEKIGASREVHLTHRWFCMSSLGDAEHRRACWREVPVASHLFLNYSDDNAILLLCVLCVVYLVAISIPSPEVRNAG